MQIRDIIEWSTKILWINHGYRKYLEDIFIAILYSLKLFLHLDFFSSIFMDMSIDTHR